MKNVAKCDTWCELQNPVNHRVFERKLRPKPLGRGHVCMGVTHRVAPLLSPPWGERNGGRILASRAPWCAVGPNMIPRRRVLRSVVVLFSTRFLSWRIASFVRASSLTPLELERAPSTATPCQAGLPAEFKHINKRRKRNLQGFP